MGRIHNTARASAQLCLALVRLALALATAGGGSLFVLFAFVVVFAFAIWETRTAPAPTPAEQAARADARDQKEWKRSLCHVAAACGKYSAARLECATAGNFKTCIQIKMGNDAYRTGVCSGDQEGAPAVPVSPETPNAVSCFFRTLWR
jgi:hypothetical protein